MDYNDLDVLVIKEKVDIPKKLSRIPKKVQQPEPVKIDKRLSVIINNGSHQRSATSSASEHRPFLKKNELFTNNTRVGEVRQCERKSTSSFNNRRFGETDRFDKRVSAVSKNIRSGTHKQIIIQNFNFGSASTTKVPGLDPRFQELYEIVSPTLKRGAKQRLKKRLFKRQAEENRKKLETKLETSETNK